MRIPTKSLKSRFIQYQIIYTSIYILKRTAVSSIICDQNSLFMWQCFCINVVFFFNWFHLFCLPIFRPKFLLIFIWRDILTSDYELNTCSLVKHRLIHGYFSDGSESGFISIRFSWFSHSYDDNWWKRNERDGQK